MHSEVRVRAISAPRIERGCNKETAFDVNLMRFLRGSFGPKCGLI